MSRFLLSYYADHSKLSQGLSFIDDCLGQLCCETVLQPFCASESVRILLKFTFRVYYAFQGHFIFLLLVRLFCKFVGALHMDSEVRDGFILLSHEHRVSTLLCVTPGCTVPVRRHGARYDRRQDCGRSLLAERSACHCLAGACHRVQLQSNLSSKPEGRQEESAKGKVNLFVQSVSFIVSLSTAALSYRTLHSPKRSDSCLA